MSKGLGKRERQILCKMYTDYGSMYLDDFEQGIRQSGVSTKTTFYALERLIKKGLVTKHKGDGRIWYNLTGEGQKVAGDVFNEVDTLISSRLGMFVTGSGKTRARKILSRLQDLQEQRLDYLEGKKTIPEPEIPIENLPGEGIALVDFYAEWCEPCKSLEPFIDELKEEFKDKDVKFVKVDVDRSKKLASKYKVEAMPTLLILKDGVVIKKKVGFSGFTDYDILKKELESALPKAADKCKDGVCQLPQSNANFSTT